MRHTSQNRRSRNRGGQNNARRNNGNRAKVFDSNGPEVRIRGTAHQICEKYMALAKDAASTGDTILAESYLQHAEHYQRIINEAQGERPAQAEKTPKAYSDIAGEQTADGNTISTQEDDLSLPASILGSDAKPNGAAKTESTVPATQSSALETA